MGQSEPWNDGYEKVLRIPQTSRITWASRSDSLVSYQGHSLGRGSYSSAETQSIYFIASADWVKLYQEIRKSDSL